MRTWLDVARLTKTTSHGKGFAVQCTANLPFVLRAGMPVRFAPPQIDLPRAAKVLGASETAEGEYSVEFAYVDGDPAPLDMIGMHCLVRRSDIDLSLLDCPGDLIAGYLVFDAKFGCIGTLSGFTDNKAQQLLRVEPAEGEGEILIPFVDEFILGIDEDGGRVDVDIPQGIMSLNAGL